LVLGIWSFWPEATAWECISPGRGKSNAVPSGGLMQVRALRGATTVATNTKEEIASGTAELLREMMSRNGIIEKDIISVVFTATDDLNAEFPAAAARNLGFKTVPLLCAREIPVPGATPRCIRILMHFHSEKDPGELRHTYLQDAKRLRTDLPE
jgi:chorismate mutase